MALRVELGGTADTLRKDKEETTIAQEPQPVLWDPRQVPELGRPIRRERQPSNELVRHGLCKARRLELQETRRMHDQGVNRIPPRVIPDKHRGTARRNA